MTYDELISTVYSYTIREDIPVTTMIRLAEANLRPLTKHYLGEKTAVLTVTDELASLPADFIEMRAITGASRNIYKPISATVANVQEGEVGYYRIADDLSFVAASNGSVDPEVTLAYWSAFPALTSTSSNWLFDRFPNIYLRAVLKESFRWLKDAEGVAIEDAALREELSSLFEDDRRGRQTGPIYWSPSSWQ
ncbi:hypothetical protein MZK49_05660 [Ensifer sesbaniae]|uniref:phage adaptor protein n=1 Tax=Ensifer sesbaniae TaxID=1214071 RepID=UPI002001AE9E|nr:hypothetical protein [Ensifer sesbaniae]